MSRFKGKNAVVTGGTQGIGAAIVRRFIADGGDMVAVVDLPEKEGQMVDLADLSDKVTFIACDIRETVQVNAMAEKAEEILGHIDVLFSNAGIIARNPFPQMPIEELEDVLQVNVVGTAAVGQKIALHMIKNGIKGAIVNTASINSLSASPGIAAYCTSKGAVLLLTKAMALDLGDYGIRVNCFGPSTTKTPMTVKTTANPEKEAFFFAKLNIKRWAEAEDQANAACFLASDEASYMTGAYIPVDGGTTSRF